VASDVSSAFSRPAANLMNMYLPFVGKHVVCCELVHLIVRGHKSTEIKARMNAIENKCGVCFGCHAPHENGSAQHFFPFHDLCSTVCGILFCYVDVNVAAEDQYVIWRVRTDGEWTRFSAISEPEGSNHQCWSELRCN
jgi:hypothetical protein